MTVLAGRLVLPDGIEDGWLVVEDGIIAAIEHGTPPASVRAEVFPGSLIGPGFIDAHVHGGGGGDFMEGTLESLRQVLAFHGSHGTTSLVASTVAADSDAISSALARIRRQIAEQDDPDRHPLPDVLGAHLEGPYINTARSGGQDADAIRAASIEEFTAWSEIAPIRMITLAPEITGGLDLVRHLGTHRPDVVISAGHTDATFPQLAAAVDEGVSHLTHFMSGMSPFHHRDPGAAGAGFMLDTLTLDVIPDLIHMDPDVLRFVIQSKNPGQVILITDAVNFAGLADGDYEKRGRRYHVSDGLVRLASNDSLAGSTLTMERGVKNVVDLGIDVAAAWAMASAAPADLLGIQDRKGRLQVGADADITIVDESWTVERTITRGQTIHSRRPGGTVPVS